LSANQSLDELTAKWSWCEHLQEVYKFLGYHLQNGAAVDDGVPVETAKEETSVQECAEDTLGASAHATTISEMLPTPAEAGTTVVAEDNPFDMMAFLSHAEMAAQRTMNELSVSDDSSEPAASVPTFQSLNQRSSPPEIHQSPYAPNSTYAQELAAQIPSEQIISLSPQTGNGPGIALPPAKAASTTNLYPAPFMVDLSTRQTVSTQEQYEKARQSTFTKTTSKNRPPHLLPSQRRPWSQDEEIALMTGLDRVRGPYWSQILAMYGEHGTINEVLKDRNRSS